MVPLTFLHELQPLLGTCTFLEEELVAACNTSTSLFTAHLQRFSHSFGPKLTFGALAQVQVAMVK